MINWIRDNTKKAIALIGGGAVAVSEGAQKVIEWIGQPPV